jgi:hypothetical protein
MLTTLAAELVLCDLYNSDGTHTQPDPAYQE